MTRDDQREMDSTDVVLPALDFPPEVDLAPAGAASRWSGETVPPPRVEPMTAAATATATKRTDTPAARGVTERVSFFSMPFLESRRNLAQGSGKYVVKSRDRPIVLLPAKTPSPFRRYSADRREDLRAQASGSASGSPT